MLKYGCLLHFQPWNTEFYPLNKSDIFTACYFLAVKISKALFSQCENNKQLWHVMYCLQCQRFERKPLKKCFWGWKWNSPVSWDRILHLWQYQKSCLTHKINSIFNVKPLNILFHCKYKPLLVCSRKTEYDILHN